MLFHTVLLRKRAYVLVPVKFNGKKSCLSTDLGSRLAHRITFFLFGRLFVLQLIRLRHPHPFFDLVAAPFMLKRNGFNVIPFRPAGVPIPLVVLQISSLSGNYSADDSET